MLPIRVDTPSFRKRSRDRSSREATRGARITFRRRRSVIWTAMKKLIMASAVLLMPAMAEAQSPQLESTCQIVAKNFLLTDHLNVGIVQSFPELKPPGTRLTYSTRPGASKSDMSDSFECEFDKTDPPYHLTRFCVSEVCYSASDADAERKRRFDEMRVLLDRTNK
ncbi:hypothetical protein [Rhizobium rhizogenes]|uniref:hypothetical protein n=1 Tax=Rhizobium rhizogenes TaxID=359 RepID=UPI003F4F67BD